MLQQLSNLVKNPEIPELEETEKRLLSEGPKKLISAMVSKLTGDFERAESILLDLLKDKNHRDTAFGILHLIDVYALSDRKEKIPELLDSYFDFHQSQELKEEEKLVASYKNLAYYFRDRNQIDLYEKTMKKALKLLPENAELNGVYAFLKLEDRKAPKEALPYFEKSLSISKSDLNFIANYISNLIALHKLEEAKPLVNEILERTRNYPNRNTAKALYLKTIINLLEGKPTDDYLACLKGILLEKPKFTDWPVNYLLSTLTGNNIDNDKIQLLDVVARAFHDSELLKVLSKDELWEKLNPKSLAEIL